MVRGLHAPGRRRSLLQRTRATAVEAAVGAWEAKVNAIVTQLVAAAEIH